MSAELHTTPRLLTVLQRWRHDPATAAVRGELALSRAALVARALAWRAWFAPQAPRWALYMTDGFDFAAALLGAWAAGKTVLLPGDALPGTVARLAERVDGFVGDFPPGTGRAHAPVMPPAVAEDAAAPLLDADAALLEVFTSGSTGEPVAIPKRLRQLACEVEAHFTLWGESLQGSVVRGTVSHQHIYGLLFRILGPLANDLVFDAASLPFPEDIAAAGARGPFALIASPAHLKRLHDALPWADARRSLRAVFSSGGPLPEDAASTCHTLLGRAPIEVYGSSETGGIAWRVRAEHGERWQPLPAVTIACDEAGQLLVHSPYLPDTLPFRCADRAALLADGGFRLLGRADRIVKIEEKRVSLDALEAELQRSPLVREARALELEAPRRCLAAVVVLDAAGEALLAAEGKRALNTALRRHLGASFETAALPRRWRYLAALPHNPQGKTTQDALRALFATARPTQPVVTTLSREDAKVIEQWQVPADLLYFEGHFPIAPILPGVVQLDWAIARGRAHFPLAPQFKRIEALKFQQVIQPGATLQVELGFRADTQSLSFRIASGQHVHASGRVVFGEAS